MLDGVRSPPPRVQVGGGVALALAAAGAGRTHLRGRFPATTTESIIQSHRDRLDDRLLVAH